MKGPALLAGTALLLLLLVPTASAQSFAADPFFERSESLRHAFGMRLMESRLRGIEALLSEAEATTAVEQASELAEDLVEEDLRLFAGSLDARDPDLLQRLRAGLDNLQGAVAAGDSADAAITEVSGLLAEASDVLAPADASNPPFVAAVIALLLLSEDGVAEAYEDAVAEDPAEFALGWATLQTVGGFWESLSDGVDAQLREDVNEALAELKELLPGPLPEGALTGDPEDAEEPAHRVVALLERATDARLHPDRDLAQLVRYVSNLAEQGCDDLAGGRQLLGVERLTGAFLGYEYLEDLVGLMAPGAHEQVDGAFEQLLEEEGSDSEVECRRLLEGLEEVRPIVGG